MFLTLQVFSLLLGLCVGSFLNVCISRMPEDRSVVSPRSHCPSCGTDIAWYDNVPVLSWCWLRGRCRHCATEISSLYPIIELITGLIALLFFRRLFDSPLDISPLSMATWCCYFLFLSALIATTFIDLKHYIIPDEFSIYAVPVGVLICALLEHMRGLAQPPWAAEWALFQGSLTLPGWRQSVLGALLGGGVLWAVMTGYRLIRKEEGMGFGDVKLLAMLGAFLGPYPAIPFIILASSISGSVVGILLMITYGRGLRSQVPFGPFLALSAGAYLFWGEELISTLLPSLL